MPNLPTVSVVTPCFNPGKYLTATIESVLTQDYPSVEYLVMDGGSTDGTVEILRHYGDKVRWVSQSDRGQADAINKGFGKTNGEILAWLNADDTYAPGAIRTAAQFFADHPEIDVVYGNADFIDAAGRFIGRCAHIEPFNVRRLRHYSDFIVQPAAFFRRSAFDAVGGVDPDLHWSMDYDLWLKFAKSYRFAHIPEILAHYRWLGESKTAGGGRRRLEEIGAMMARHGYPMPAYVRLEWINLLLQEAIASFKSRRLGTAVMRCAQAGGKLVASPRAMGSLLSPHTWKIIYTGQVLRQRALEENARVASESDSATLA